MGARTRTEDGCRDYLCGRRLCPISGGWRLHGKAQSANRRLLRRVRRRLQVMVTSESIRGRIHTHMRKLLAVAVLLFCAGAAQGQTTHSVSLTWTDTLNPVGTTYTVYRAAGLCSGSPVFNKLATGLPLTTAATPYVDTAVTTGN